MASGLTLNSWKKHEILGLRSKWGGTKYGRLGVIMPSLTVPRFLIKENNSYCCCLSKWHTKRAIYPLFLLYIPKNVFTLTFIATGNWHTWIDQTQLFADVKNKTTVKLVGHLDLVSFMIVCCRGTKMRCFNYSE